MFGTAQAREAATAGGSAQPPVPITVRQLEAIVRIAESLARMQLQPEATQAHVQPGRGPVQGVHHGCRALRHHGPPGALQTLSCPKPLPYGMELSCALPPEDTF